MALFKSGNPALSEKTFQDISYTNVSSDTMTVRGTLNKLGFLLALLTASAVFSWGNFYNNSEYAAAFTWGGAIGGLILCLIMIFKRELAGYLAPAYAICEGLFIGGAVFRPCTITHLHPTCPILLQMRLALLWVLLWQCSCYTVFR